MIEDLLCFLFLVVAFEKFAVIQFDDFYLLLGLVEDKQEGSRGLTEFINGSL